MSELKTYTIQFDESRNKGTYAIAVVEDPAMQDAWITLSKDSLELNFETIDNEKKLLLGAAIVPNKRIYRNVGGHEFYVVFEEQVIEKIAHNFLKGGFQNNSSENHEKVIKGTTVVESWMVEDPEKDKSNLYGKQYEKGTWVVMMKVDNPEIWQKAKDKKLTGFSIEAGLGLKELKLKNEKMPEENSIIKAIKDGFAALSKKEEVVELKELKLSDKKTTLIFEGEKPEVGKAIFVKPAEKTGEKVLAPEGEYVLESGEKLYVDKDGAVAEAPAAVADPVNQEEVVAEMKKQVKELSDKLQLGFNLKLKVIQDLLDAEKQKNVDLEAKLAKVPADDSTIVKLEVIKEPKTAKQRLMNAVISAQNSN